METGRVIACGACAAFEAGFVSIAHGDEEIEATIDACGGSLPKTARVLEVSPSTLYRKKEIWAAQDDQDDDAPDATDEAASEEATGT